ncbi:MAG: ABC transporter permease [Verrucomicrobiales bacterium]
MTSFFPVALRELQSAARRRGIYRARYLVWGLSMLGGTIVLLLAKYLPGKLPQGVPLFWFVSGVAMFFCSIAGFLLTCDAISREKREGTLGLLFLTELGLHEIIVGKMAAASLFGATAILVITPVMAVSVCMGGVTGPQFWMMTIALLNLLCFSLALGLFLSSLSRSDHQAAAMFVIIFLGWPGLGMFYFVRSNFLSLPGFAIWHPIYPIMEATGLMPAVFNGHFVRTVGGNVAGVFALLAATCLATRISFLKSGGDWRQKIVFRQVAHAARPRKVNGAPLLWLQGLGQNRELFFWTLVAAVSGVVILAVSSKAKIDGLIFLFAVHYLLALLITWKACNLMAGLKQNGLIEILLTTPLRMGEVLSGQQQALQQFFFKPRLLVLILHGLYVVPAFARDSLATEVTLGLFSLLLFMIESYSFIWIGFWQGWAAKNSRFAMGRIVLLQVVAWLPLFIGLALVFFVAGKAFPIPYLRLALCGIAMVTILNLGFALWGLFQLSTRFRRSVSG